jgi:hypothetical protein
MCFNALAFSTLLSSQGADAHRWEALAFPLGQPFHVTRRGTLRQPSSLELFVGLGLRPATKLLAPGSCAHAHASGGRLFGGCPGSCPLSRASRPDSKNSRGAGALRQIELGYRVSHQVRRDVTRSGGQRPADWRHLDDPETPSKLFAARLNLLRNNPEISHQRRTDRYECGASGTHCRHCDIKRMGSGAWVQCSPPPSAAEIPGLGRILR